MKNYRTPVSVYKHDILKILRQIWKSDNEEMWCGLYSFINNYPDAVLKRSGEHYDKD